MIGHGMMGRHQVESRARQEAASTAGAALAGKADPAKAGVHD
jgi:hypothetical protein